MTEYEVRKRNFIWFVIISTVAVSVVMILNHNQTNDKQNRTDFWLGVETIQLNKTIIQQYDIVSPNGLLVSRTFLGSPAAIAGIKDGDIIRRWNGVSVTDQDQFERLINKTGVNNKIKVTLDRGGKQIMVHPQLGLRPGKF